MDHKLSSDYDDIGEAIIGAAIKVHKAMGPGLLEKIYEVCLTHELRKAGFDVKRQVKLPIVYDGIIFEEGLQLELLVNDKTIVEVKAIDDVHPYWKAQIISCLKLANKRLGYLINFNNPLLKDGVRRFRN